MSRWNRLKRFAGSRRLRTRTRAAALPWLILAAVILAAVSLAVLLGNILKKEMRPLLISAPEGISVSAGTVTVPDLTAEAFRFGYSVSPGGTASGEGVSVLLSNEEGRLTYSSEVARHMNRQSSEENLPDPREEIRYLHENHRYVSGIFIPHSFTCTGQAEIAEEYYEFSLFAELADCGIDEIILLIPSATETNEEHLLSYLRQMRSAAPDVAIGIPLSRSCFTGDHAEDELRTLLRFCDLFLLDLRGEEEPAELADFLNNNVYCLHAFPVRFLLSEQDDSLREFLLGGGYSNLQFYP